MAGTGGPTATETRTPEETPTDTPTITNTPTTTYTPTIDQNKTSNQYVDVQEPLGRLAHYVFSFGARTGSIGGASPRDPRRQEGGIDECDGGAGALADVCRRCAAVSLLT